MISAPQETTATAVGGSRIPMPQPINVTARPPRPTGLIKPSVSVTSMSDGPATDSDSDVSVPAMSPPRVPVASVRKDGSVQVAVRVRPLLPKEMATNAKICIQSDGNTVHLPSNEKSFTFDHVFPTEATQEDLYAQIVQPLMEPFLQGFNVTVLAYGQTGSGKTYTMGNAPSTNALAPKFFQKSTHERIESDEQVKAHQGVIPRFIHDMFRRLAEDEEQSSNQVSVSFLEIYGEDIRDLLDRSHGGNRDNLQIRESNGTVWVQGLTEVKVASAEEAAEQMRIGGLQRVTGSTGMNEHSSRSHAVYTVKIVRRIKGESGGLLAETGSATSGSRFGSRKTLGSQASSYSADNESETTIVSKLTFVDLAGSERLKRTQAEGERMKEGIQINVGLLALGNVITALGDERRRSNPRQHVSYRDSKLTRLLQDALGGNSRTLFIACVSPAESNASETVNTLQYANRAKNIQNKAVKNIDPRSAELIRLKSVLEAFRRELVKARFYAEGDIGMEHIDMTALMQDPVIVDYLRQVEDAADSAGAIQGGRISLNVSKIAFAMHGDSTKNANGPTSTPSSGADVISTTSSIAIMEETSGTAGSSIHLPEALDEVDLKRLAKVVEVMQLSLEMRDLTQHLSRAKHELDAKVTGLDTRITRNKAIADALDGALHKMETWQVGQTDAALDQHRQRQYSAAKERLLLIQNEIDSLESEKSKLAQQFDDLSTTIRKELKQKQDCIQQVRGAGGSDVQPSPLDVIVQAVELKYRFGLNKLSTAAWALENEEKECVDFLETKADSIAFFPTLSARAEWDEVDDIACGVLEGIQRAIIREDLQTSLSVRLRQRTEVLQRILLGWGNESTASTEEEFIRTNENQLRECEECIRDLSDSLRHWESRTCSVTSLIDAIESVDTSKKLNKRLVEIVYGCKRLLCVNQHVPTSIKQDLPPATGAKHDDSRTAVIPGESGLTAQEYEREIKSLLDIVAPFSAGTLCEENESRCAKLFSEANDRNTQLELDMIALRDRIAGLEEQNASLKRSVEARDHMLDQWKHNEKMLATLERCRSTAAALGVLFDENDFFDEVQLKKAAQALADLESTAEGVQERIDAAYIAVKKLEFILQVDEPVDVRLQTHARGKTLLAQEQELTSLMVELQQELLQRVDSRIRGLESIHSLLVELQVHNTNDLRHTTSQLSSEDLDRVRSDMEQLSHWDQARSSSDAMQVLLDAAAPTEATFLSSGSFERAGFILKVLLKEKARRHAEVTELLQDIRALISQMDLSLEEIKSVVRASFAERFELPDDDEALAITMQSITNKGGQIDISISGLSSLVKARDTLLEIRDGRVNAISFIYSVLDEAASGLRVILESSGLEVYLNTPLTGGNQEAHMKEYGCCREALKIGVEKLNNLAGPIDLAVKALISSMSDDFMAFGIETAAQRISFFLGSEDSSDHPIRRVLEKYLGDERELKSSIDGELFPASDSFLSDADPLHDAFATFYSAAYGTHQIATMKTAASEVSQLKSMIQAAHERLRSLQKIMQSFNNVNNIKRGIAKFNEETSGKDRLFGNSVNLLKEDRMRKQYTKQLKLALNTLRNELNKWLQNEGGKYDLNILGQEMKALVIDMTHVDTDLLHLDLGMIDASRPSVRRASKTSAAITAATASMTQASAQNQMSPANTLPRARPGPALTRETSTKKRIIADP